MHNEKLNSKGLNKEQVEDINAKIKHMSGLDCFFLLGALILLHMEKAAFLRAAFERFLI